MQAIPKGFMFIGSAEAATEVEHPVVIFQRQYTQNLLHLFESVSDLHGIAFVGLGIGLV